MKYRHGKRFFRNVVRTLLQLSFAFFAFWVTFAFFDGAGVHNICPWTVVEVPLISLRAGIDVFFVIGIAIGIVTIVASFVFPRVFCGWVCPLGTVSELLGGLGKVLRMSAKRLPHWLNEKLRIFSTGVLALLVLLTLWTGNLVCTVACPAFWMCAAFKIAIPAVSIVFLVLYLAVSLRVERGFCRYLCPHGALLAFFSKKSHFVLSGNVEACNSCKLCEKSCPMGIDIAAHEKIESAHCISCNDCIISCPKSGLHWSVRRK